MTKNLTKGCPAIVRGAAGWVLVTLTTSRVKDEQLNAWGFCWDYWDASTKELVEGFTKTEYVKEATPELLKKHGFKLEKTKAKPSSREAAERILAMYNSSRNEQPDSVLASPEPVCAIAYHLGYRRYEGTSWWDEVMDQVSSQELFSEAFVSARVATKAEARALRVGDVIAAYYKDDEEPVFEVVIEGGGCYNDVKTLSKKEWESGKTGVFARGLNTDRFKRVGRLTFKF